MTWKRLTCWLLGHNDLLHQRPATIRESGRVWIVCEHCGRETAGWNL